MQIPLDQAGSGHLPQMTVNEGNLFPIMESP